MRPKRDSSYGTVKALLLLGRTSNLPTVWSNCLAAWLLAGGGLTESGDVQRFVWLNVGATLLYLAGMFLNDAFDVKFDREHRAERPIPCGAISVKAVWTLGVGQMILGLACVISVNVPAAACALALVGSILWYDWVHKKIAWSPLIMGLCRLFLYLLTGAIAVGEITLPVLLGSIAIWAYIVGLSNIARKEATKGSVNSWPCWLLALPLFLVFTMPYLAENRSQIGTGLVVAALIYLLWTVRSLLFTFKSMIPQYGRTVSGLLAGLVLFDFLLAASQNLQLGLVFFVLFASSLIFQKFIPAT